MQDYTKVNLTDLVKTAILKLDSTAQSLASSFSGTEFPTNNVSVGMTCYRTDRETLYLCTAVDDNGQGTWTEIGIVGVSPGTDDDGNTISTTYATQTEMASLKSELKALIESAKKIACPLVGDIICTKNSSNPSKRYPNTTWQLLGANQFLMSVTAASDIGNTGGANTHTITVAEMPSHTHSITVYSSGNHTHTRGSMNITGNVTINSAWTSSTGTGALYTTDSYQEFTGGKYWQTAVNQLYFDASKSWTGETSAAGSHTHTATAYYTGSGRSYDCRPAYISVFMWIRVA